MLFDLDEDQRDLRDTARELFGARVTEPQPDSDSSLWRELVELDWPGVGVGEEYGGSGLGAIETALLVREHGRAMASTPFVGAVTAARVIQVAGDEPQRERWLPALASGSARGTAGDDLVGDVDDVDCVVLARPDELRLVAAPQLQIQPVTTIDALRSYGRVAIGGEALEGDIQLAIANAIVLASAELVGVAERALAESIEYAKERVQFGRPIGSFQAVAHRCAEMRVLTESAQVLLFRAAWACDSACEEAPRAASLAKAAATDAAREATATAIQVHGGYGFTWEAPLHWLYKRAQVAGALWGTSAAHRIHLINGEPWAA